MNKIIYSVIIIILIGFFSYQIKSSIKPGSSDELPYVTVNNQIFKVEIADTLAKQIQGLSGKTSLCTNCGMFFVFSDSQTRKFWMKNMNFPLDIIWIKDNVIVNISNDLPPEAENPENTYSSIAPANYVLEINAGLAEKLKIKIGDKIKYFF